MFLKRINFIQIIFLTVLTLLMSIPSSLWACACGCGVFDVGTSAMLPSHEGGMVYLEYDYLNQDKNWHNGSKAPTEDNEDRETLTHFYTVGGQYMFNRKWGAALDIPYWKRSSTMMMDDGAGGEVETEFSHTSLGDIRLRGIFTGFSPDLATGVTFGVKFPSGGYQYENFDRDLQIGTGSTDLLLGAFHRGALTENRVWNYFLNLQADLPVLITPDYRPGNEVNAVTGISFGGMKFGGLRIVPIAQAIGSVRWSDTGEQAAHADSGYKRVVLSPGLEFSLSNWRLYTDIGFPVYQYVNGNQLVATKLYKVNISRRF